MTAIKNLIKGASVRLDELTSDAKQTQPPGRFSESYLAKVLAEDLAIGRPSTLSSIISTIQERGYVVRKGTQLYPTALGFAIARLLNSKLPEFVSYDKTAAMEEELDDIANGSLSRVKFLEDFWSGEEGLENILQEIMEFIEYDELQKYSTIDLYNGYKVKFSRFGTFIEDSNGTPNAKGYLPSAKIEDDADLWTYKDPEVCKKLLKESANRQWDRTLGVLESGEYEGWTVSARSGKFGDYLQAVHPDYTTAIESGKKPSAKIPAPVNQKFPSDIDPGTATLEKIKHLFEEVRLPRWSEDKLWLVGVGKKNNPYMGRKNTLKGRPLFKKLPEGVDPRTVCFEKIQEYWAEAEAAAKKKKK